MSLVQHPFKFPFVYLAAIFGASRILYYLAGVRFDSQPLYFYLQYVDPVLLRTDFWRSLYLLEQQPPAYNFYLGAILHLFPAHPEIAFQATHLILGLALCLSLYALMSRLGVQSRVALTIAAVFAISPSTVLYENLLFYEYPLTALFCIAALFLHRYASAGRTIDGAVFFSCLALLAGIRSIYHLAWFAAISVFVWFALRRWSRRTLAAVALPAVFVLSFYLKNFVLFHSLVPGSSVYGGRNIAYMSVSLLPRNVLEAMVHSGTITPILTGHVCDVVPDPADGLAAKTVPMPPPAGAPLLDNCRKSNGTLNFNCRWLAETGRVCSKDSVIVFRNHPGPYFRSVVSNMRRYFAPAAESWPFDGRPPGQNWIVLSGALKIEDLLTAGQWGRPWLHMLGFPVLFGFGMVTAFSRLRQGALHDATTLTLGFILFNIAYLSAAVLLLAAFDQNRYRLEISTFFAVLLGLLLSRRRTSRAVA